MASASKHRPAGQSVLFNLGGSQLSTGAGVSALLAILVLLRRRLSEDPSDRFRNAVSRANRKNGTGTGATPLTTPQMEQAQRELYVPLPDGSRELLVPDSRGRIKRVLIKPTKASTFSKHRQEFVSSSSSSKSGVIDGGTKDSSSANGPADSTATLDPASSNAKRGVPKPGPAASQQQQSMRKVGVNKEFLRQLRAIFKIIIPRCVWVCVWGA